MPIAKKEKSSKELAIKEKRKVNRVCLRTFKSPYIVWNNIHVENVSFYLEQNMNKQVYWII